MALNQIYKTSLSLLTDLYQLTMAFGYWKTNSHHKESVFHLFFRKPPFNGGFVVTAGLQDFIDFILGFKYQPEDLEYLATLKTRSGPASRGATVDRPPPRVGTWGFVDLGRGTSGGGPRGSTTVNALRAGSAPLRCGARRVRWFAVEAYKALRPTREAPPAVAPLARRRIGPPYRGALWGGCPVPRFAATENPSCGVAGYRTPPRPCQLEVGASSSRDPRRTPRPSGPVR
jgi:hypothetical protein